MLLLFYMNKNKIIMKFSQCGSVLYDEEIMAGWTPEDSNLNTICCWCKHPTVPNLSIKVHTFIIRDDNHRRAFVFGLNVMN